jgi:cytochrome c oxidase assembly protein subunit 15
MTGEPKRIHDLRPSAFARAAWLVLGYTLAVIVFGAWVRITGSGAGCGQHWPTCHGEIVHRPQSIETVIELTHRVTSGLSLLVEALLGAGLVAFGLVEDDDSIARAVVMAIHLTNTCILMGALAAAAWTGVDGVDRRPQRPSRSQAWLLGAAMVMVLLVSMSGAVTALGDTLFPVAADGTVREHIAGDQSVTAHFLQRMRIVHPVLAIGVGLYLLWLAIALPDSLSRDPSVRRLGNLVAGLVLAQLCAGVANIMLSAPGWMQLVHLALATALWTAVVVLALAVLGSRQRNT